MKIRRTIEIVPSFVLIAIFIYSLYLKSVNGVWVNLFVIGVAGLSAYIPVAVFIEAIANSFRNIRPVPLRDKLFYGYLIIIWVIALVVAIGSMGQA
ncbi:LasU family protein [Companilactobacillus pabuli]|jgi:hypothetical protein|uniref:Uncharacterized protein n=1 Tax=Companilactobacillus pabuli TaxID=2714036 RepID=A0A7L7KWF2_9LACO|nr:LasU family protein [Companilactobacillus pabuli]AKP02232.1 hypothetical protein ABB45_00450 [Companilactobacillus farciminis]AKS50529.1 hypothetical protein ABB44_00450 [Companilactobacillus farciminis]MDG5113621.1 LasU family protein [Companilactobacillus pabuli]QMT83656.1 hypothetical protein G6534_03035 [Companilactobacillus pabuli]GAQ02333.1 hypothetical protein NBRC111452_2176 [Companilactobacillus farciminis]